MSEVKLEGVNEINLALQIAQAKISEIVAKTVEEVCKAGAVEAKEIITQMGAVDTGALRGSITGDVTKANASQVEGQIVAGTNVMRGVGEYEFSQKTGQKRSVEVTSEYAESVEYGGGYGNKGARPFMGSTYNWLKSEFPKQMFLAVKEAIKRIGR